MSYPTSGLRTDERQWLIYDDESIGALTRGLEAWALAIASNLLEENRIAGLRGIGSLMSRIADQRLVTMKRNGGAQEVVADWILLVSAAAAGKTPWTPDVDMAIDELHAVGYRLDSRGSSAGILGPGVHRAAIRGD